MTAAALFALVTIHHADRAALAELPLAAPAGSLWLTAAGWLRIDAAGRAVRLGRAL